jgi:CDP-6-deoxy-D-xylo-4-hexulose-3-dehydrase
MNSSELKAIAESLETVEIVTMHQDVIICGCRFEQKTRRFPYGYDHKYVYSHFGYNLKITDMQAACG